MSSRTGESSPTRWSWLPPAGLALLYHGLAHDRLAGAMLTLASLAFVVWRELRLSRSGRGWIVLLLVGMVLGALQLPLSEPPSGPIGPFPLSLLTGAMQGLLIWFLLSDQVLWLGVTQWVLLALSSSVSVSGPLWGVLWGFIMATLVQGGVATRVAKVFAARGGWRTGLVAGGVLAIALAASPPSTRLGAPAPTWTRRWS